LYHKILHPLTCGIMFRLLVYILLLSLSLGAVGCQRAAAPVYHKNTKVGDSGLADKFICNNLKTKPRARLGYLPGPILTTKFLDIQSLGQHGYRPNPSEKNGIVYTCKAGQIDISHARKAADWTAFLAAKTYQQIEKKKTKFSFKMHEPSVYYVKLTYPKNWDDMSREQKEHITYEVSVSLGQYLAFLGVTWHEIITWFGFKSAGLISEYCSAFTWEDNYSNLFGTHIAVIALGDSIHTYNQAITLAFEEELKKLNAQPAYISRRAAESVNGSWFTCLLFFADMKKRNFDLGLDDGFITPTLLPFSSKCKAAEPQPLQVPDLKLLSDYGFSAEIEIKPKVWEGKAILDIVYKDKGHRRRRFKPAIHLSRIMDYIRTDAIKRYGPEVDLSHPINVKIAHRTR